MLSRPVTRLVPKSPSHLLRLSQRHQRRLASFTAPPSQKPRSFRGALLRWTVAGGAVYWYMTREEDVFTDDARNRLHASKLSRQPLILETQDVDEQLPTIDSITAARQQRLATAAGPSTPDTMPQQAIPTAPSLSSPSPVDFEPAKPLNPATTAADPASQPVEQAATAPAPESATASAQGAPPGQAGAPIPPSPAALEEEAQTEGAFNEETGEINWDCPCLGGMAYGPCGEQFREAFSCFVYSKEEPKGVDCIERFKSMQDCFREHPDVYGAELAEDEAMEDEDAAGAPVPADSPTPALARAEPATAQQNADPLPSPPAEQNSRS